LGIGDWAQSPIPNPQSPIPNPPPPLEIKPKKYENFYIIFFSIKNFKIIKKEK